MSNSYIYYYILKKLKYNNLELNFYICYINLKGSKKKMRGNFNTKKIMIMMTLYFFGIIGFIDYHYDSINSFIKTQSLQNKYNPQFNNMKLVRRDETTTSEISCEYDVDCNNGVCFLNERTNESYCECDAGWKSLNDNGDPTDIPCDYDQLSWLAALLISIFVGGCGVDWCFLSRGNGCYICLGILKAITLGGLTIWYIVDIVRVATNDFNDGNGVELDDS